MQYPSIYFCYSASACKRIRIQDNSTSVRHGTSRDLFAYNGGMSNSDYKKYPGQKHHGSQNTAPYPVSRLGANVELVDLARQISQADAMLNTRVSSKLQVIADQIRLLQAEARNILAQTQQDQELHRLPCNFKKAPGKIYHVYSKPNGQHYFSMLSPAEWGQSPPHAYQGSYRLENDQSWTPTERLNEEDNSRELVMQLLNKLPQSSAD